MSMFAVKMKLIIATAISIFGSWVVSGSLEHPSA